MSIIPHRLLRNKARVMKDVRRCKFKGIDLTKVFTEKSFNACNFHVRKGATPVMYDLYNNAHYHEDDTYPYRIHEKMDEFQLTYKEIERMRNGKANRWENYR